MRHPVSRELFRYWDALRAGRSAPERSAVDPAAIRDLLAYTFLLEIGPGGGSGSRAASFRLSGTRLNALFRRELKGCAFAALWSDRDRGEATALLDGVLDGCTPAVAGVSGAPDGETPTDFELLLLPLRHHGRTHARLLGSVAADSVPSWIGLRPVRTLGLISCRTILPRDGGRLGRFGGSHGQEDAAPSVPPRLTPPRTAETARFGRFEVYQGGRSGPASTGRGADFG